MAVVVVKVVMVVVVKVMMAVVVVKVMMMVIVSKGTTFCSYVPATALSTTNLRVHP